MKRIDTTYKATDKFGAGKHGFTNGSPGVTGATALTDTWFDHVQEELANAIETFGRTTLNAASYTQLSDILTANVSLKASCEVSALLRGVAARVATGALFDDVFAAACSPSGRIVIGGENGDMAYSNDGGASWTGVGAGSLGDVGEIVYANNLFVAFAREGDGKSVRTSPDGATWSSRVVTGAPSLLCGGWNGSVFVAASDAGATFSSSNGTSWSAAGAINAGDFTAARIAHSTTAWVLSGSPAVANRDKTLYRSTNNGTSWSAVTLSSILATTEKTVDVVCVQGVFIALVLDSGSGVYRMIRSTDDGATWSAAGNTASTTPVALAAGSHAVVVAPKNAFKVGFASYDAGASWAPCFMPGLGSVSRVCELNCSGSTGAGTRMWIGLGANGTVDDRGAVSYAPMFTL